MPDTQQQQNSPRKWTLSRDGQSHRSLKDHKGVQQKLKAVKLVSGMCYTHVKSGKMARNHALPKE